MLTIITIITIITLNCCNCCVGTHSRIGSFKSNLIAIPKNMMRKALSLEGLQVRTFSFFDVSKNQKLSRFTF